MALARHDDQIGRDAANAGAKLNGTSLDHEPSRKSCQQCVSASWTEGHILLLISAIVESLATELDPRNDQ